MPMASPHPFSFASGFSRYWKWLSGFLLELGAMDATIRDRWRQEVVNTEGWAQHIDQRLSGNSKAIQQTLEPTQRLMFPLVVRQQQLEDGDRRKDRCAI